MTVHWSPDATVLVRPAQTFRDLAESGGGGGSFWTACRRPAFIALVLGCAVSILNSGVVSARLVASTTIYWASIPAVEWLAVAIVIGRRRTMLPPSRVHDAFFVGHAPWTLLLMALSATVASVPLGLGWLLLVRVWVWAVVFTLGWSAWIDYRFFRVVVGASRRDAVRDVALQRLIAWTVVCAIFALPSMTPWGVVDVVREILRG